MTFASASKDMTIKLWDISSGRLIKSLNDHTGSVTSLALFESDRFISGSTDKSLVVWRY